MGFNLYSAPVAIARSNNESSAATRAKRALKHLGYSLRKARKGEQGPYQVVKGDLIFGFGEIVDIALWAKGEVAKQPAATAATTTATTETTTTTAPAPAAADATVNAALS